MVKNFLPKSLENPSQKKGNIKEGKISESAALIEEPKPSKNKADTKEELQEERKEPRDRKLKSKQAPKEGKSVGEKSIENNLEPKNNDDSSRKIFLSYDDIIRCANIIYGSSPNESNKNKYVETIEKPESVKNNQKSALTYIILPSFNANKPC